MNMKNAVNFMLKNGKSLMKDEKVSGGMMNMTNSLFRHPEPLGTVLIMGAWNYPFDQGSKFWPKVDCESEAKANLFLK